MIITRSPLRITLGGGGTDLPSYYGRYGGFVLSAAIDKYVYIYLNKPAADDLIRVKYSRCEEVAQVALARAFLRNAALTGGGLVAAAGIPDHREADRAILERKRELARAGRQGAQHGRARTLRVGRDV